MLAGMTAKAQEPPQMEFVMQLNVTLGEPYSIGQTVHGRRDVVPITGGTFEGPLLKGTIINGGADWQLASNAQTELEAIYSIKTDDGVNIHIRNRGLNYNGPDEHGQPSSYFLTSPQFEAPEDSRYAWLNHSIFVCMPDPKQGQGSIALNVWKVKTPPLQRIIEGGGTGPYKAVMREEPTLREHTVFVPQDLTPFGKGKQLPVLVWGNGACANSPFEHVNFLNEIASHGYIVLATGNIPMNDDWYKGPMSTTAQQIESIDWIIAQSNDPSSPYYQKVDASSICLAGMSCGGLQSLFNCADPRIKSLMICNSGLFNQQNASQAKGGMPMPPKEKLGEIHTPVIYILGGKEDIAYENGMDDFHRIHHVPACAANYPVGHGGTYRQPSGGEFSVVALAWLDWQLKGDKQASRMFSGKQPLLAEREGWTLERNKKMK